MPVSLLSEVMSSPECNYETLRQGERRGKHATPASCLVNVLGTQGKRDASVLPAPDPKTFNANDKDSLRPDATVHGTFPAVPTNLGLNLLTAVGISSYH